MSCTCDEVSIRAWGAKYARKAWGNLGAQWQPAVLLYSNWATHNMRVGLGARL